MESSPLGDQAEEVPARDKLFGAIANIRDLSKKIIEGIRKRVGCHDFHRYHQIAGAINGNNTRAGSDQPISAPFSGEDFGATLSSSAMTPAERAEDIGFISVMDRQLTACILKEGFLATSFVFLAMTICTVAVAVPFAHSKWACNEGEQNSESSWSVHAYGLLAICLCMLGVVGLCACKWITCCRCCHDVLEKSLNRAEEAEQKVLKAHRAKQLFTTYVFHNIRVPFNAIVLGLGYLRSNVEKKGTSNETKENLDLVKMMLDCAETMTRVLDDVTDMGHMEEAAMELNLEEFDMFGLVKFLLLGLKDLLYQKQMCFSLSIDPVTKAVLSSNHVVGDKHRVLQTLGNFLSNAVKFSPAGGKLELSIKCEEVFQSDLSAPCKSDTLQSGASAQMGNSPNCAGLRVEDVGKKCKKAPNSYPTYSAYGCSGQGSFVKVLIMVKDASNCISVEDKTNLFEPYSFVSPDWVQKAGVSGLGLSMARRFAEQSGGYIGVDSKEGEGSRFFFCLPYPLVPINYGPGYEVTLKDECLDAFVMEDMKTPNAQGTSDHDMSRDKIVAKEESVIQSLIVVEKSRKRVLLVEDTEINRIVLRKVLQNLNLSCEEAENGQVAVDLVKQGRTYDLILMDKEMPVMDGHEATRQLRLMGIKTPIVALTGNALQADRDLFLEAGVDDFQTKPMSKEKLVQVLARFGMEISCS